VRPGEWYRIAALIGVLLEVPEFSGGHSRVTLRSYWGAPNNGRSVRDGCFFRICNYEQVLRDIFAIDRAKRDLIILNGGQRTKNWEARTTKALSACITTSLPGGSEQRSWLVSCVDGFWPGCEPRETQNGSTQLCVHSRRNHSGARGVGGKNSIDWR